MNAERWKKQVFDWLRDYPVLKNETRERLLWKMSRRFAYISPLSLQLWLSEFMEKGESDNENHGNESRLVGDSQN